MSWLALRSASRRYIHLFNQIGTGDVEKLVVEIENEKTRFGPKQEEEAPDGLSEKGDGDNADVEMRAEDVKDEPTEASIPVEEATAAGNESPSSMAVDGGIEEKHKQVFKDNEIELIIAT